ncbi:MAG: ATP synthase subunit I [Oscillospiraceae bacterium]|nr:ATP synthase subunit I [Oscillospiraceae bacterium]
MNETNDKQQTYRELRMMALGELAVLGLIYGAFALLGKLDGKVLLGGAIGAGTAVLNYFLMAVGVFAAAARAEAGEPEKGKRIVSLSMLGRYLLMIAILVIGAKSGYCNVIAMVIPLVLFRVLLFVGEFFRRKDG